MVNFFLTFALILLEMFSQDFCAIGVLEVVFP